MIMENRIFNLIRSLTIYIYSFVFCIRYLPFKQAIKVPIYISSSVRIKQLKKGDIVFECPLRRSLVVIGFEGKAGLVQQRPALLVKNGGKIVFHGETFLIGGTSLYVNDAVLSIGSHVLFNNNGYVSCVRKNISIGDDTLFGWNVVLNTTNGHPVIINGKRSSLDGEIIIGNHVWVCAYASIGKGVEISDGCIISQRSLVLRSQKTPNVLLAGNPAKVVKENVEWCW